MKMTGINLWKYSIREFLKWSRIDWNQCDSGERDHARMDHAQVHEHRCTGIGAHVLRLSSRGRASDGGMQLDNGAQNPPSQRSR